MIRGMLAFGMPGTMEWIIIGVVALLIFGRRLPDVARSVGKSIVEFKKGIREVKDDVDRNARIEGGGRAQFDSTSGSTTPQGQKDNVDTSPGSDSSSSS